MRNVNANISFSGYKTITPHNNPPKSKFGTKKEKKNHGNSLSFNWFFFFIYILELCVVVCVCFFSLAYGSTFFDFFHFLSRTMSACCVFCWFVSFSIVVNVFYAYIKSNAFALAIFRVFRFSNRGTHKEKKTSHEKFTKLKIVSKLKSKS